MPYTTIKHPKSGETYAVEVDDLGSILGAAGPLHHSDPTDPESLAAYLANHSDTATDDARWLDDQLQPWNQKEPRP